MNKKTEKMFIILNNKYEDTNDLSFKLKDEVQKMCEFEIDITYCQGDGVLILDPSSSGVCPWQVLKDKNKKNKLTYNEFNKNCI